MDGSKRVAQSVCLFVSRLCPQRASAQRTTGGQMAQGQVSAPHSPATARRLPLQLSKGDVAECPRCPQKAVLLSPQQEFLSQGAQPASWGQTGERRPPSSLEWEGVITTRGDVSSSLGLAPWTPGPEPTLVSKGPCSPQSMLRRPHTSQPQIRDSHHSRRAVATETTALSLVPHAAGSPASQTDWGQGSVSSGVGC